jgi:hypothetical protein
VVSIILPLLLLSGIVSLSGNNWVLTEQDYMLGVGVLYRMIYVFLADFFAAEVTEAQLKIMAQVWLFISSYLYLPLKRSSFSETNLPSW